MSTRSYLWLVAILIIFSLFPIVSADYNVTVQNRTYFTEETAVPFELFLVLIVIGLLFLFAAFSSSSAGHSILFSIASMTFCASAAFVAPVAGFFTYETLTVYNATAGTTSLEFVPEVSLIAQPWIAWVMWGMFLLGLIALAVKGVGGVWQNMGMKKDEWET